MNEQRKFIRIEIEGQDPFEVEEGTSQSVIDAIVRSRTISPEAAAKQTGSVPVEPGYWEQVKSRLREQYFPSYTRSLPEVMGLTGLKKQYTEILPASRTISEGIINAIPFVGPSVNQAIAASARGRPKEAMAIATTDIAPLLVGGMKTPESAAMALRRQAANKWLGMMEPIKRKVTVAERIAPDLAASGEAALTRNRLQNQIKSKLNVIGPQIEKQVAGQPAIAVDALIADLDSMKNRMGYVKGTSVPVRENVVAAIDNLQMKLIDMMDKEDQISPQSLLDFKRKIYDTLTSASGEFREQVKPQTAQVIERAFGDSLRRLLHDEYPQLAKLDAEYSLWRTAWEFMEHSRTARIASEANIRKQAAHGFGAFTQKMAPRFLIKSWEGIVRFFDSVPWGTWSAARKSELADMISSGQMDKASQIMSNAIKIEALRGAGVRMQNNVEREYTYDPRTHQLIPR